MIKLLDCSVYIYIYIKLPVIPIEIFNHNIKSRSPQTHRNRVWTGPLDVLIQSHSRALETYFDLGAMCQLVFPHNIFSYPELFQSLPAIIIAVDRPYDVSTNHCHFISTGGICQQVRFQHTKGLFLGQLFAQKTFPFLNER